MVEQKINLKKTLKEVFGYNQFRGNQETIIQNLLDGKNTFVIMPTGAGKSLCYQLPAIVREGTAIVISPLIALMKNQVDQLNAVGINASLLNSTLSKSESNKVKKFKDSFISKRTQFSISKTAAHANFYAGIILFYPLAAA